MSENVFIEALKNNKPVNELQQLIADNPSLEIPRSAIFHATKDNIDFLLDMGLDINYSKSGSNALAYIEDIETLKILVSKGIYTKTKMITYKHYKTLDTFFYLLDLGVKPDYDSLVVNVAQEHSDDSCLKLAESFNLKENAFFEKMVRLDKLKTVEYLLQEGMKMPNGILSTVNSNEMFDLLLRYGIDISFEYKHLELDTTPTSLLRFAEYSKKDGVDNTLITNFLKHYIGVGNYDNSKLLLDNGITVNDLVSLHHISDIFKSRDMIDLLHKYSIHFKRFDYDQTKRLFETILRHDTLDLCVKYWHELLKHGSLNIMVYTCYIDNNILKNMEILLENEFDISSIKEVHLEKIDINQRPDVIIFLRKNGSKIKNLEKNLVSLVDLGIQVIDKMMNNGMDINETTHDGRNALFFTKKPEIISYLIEKGIDVNCRCNIGRNALTVVDNITAAKILIEAGINIHNFSDKNINCIWYQKDYDLTKFYLDLGVDPTQKGTEGSNALTFLLNKKAFAACRALLDSGVSIDEYLTDKDYDQLDNSIFLFIMENGGNVNYINKKGETYLFKYIEEWDYQISKRLLELGVDINIKNNKGHYVITRWIDNSIMRLVIKNGLYPGINVYDNVNIFESAVNYGCSDIVRYIVCSDFFNPNDLSILKFVSRRTKYTTVEILLQAGLKVKGMDSSLYYKSEKWNSNVIRILLEYGMDISKDLDINIDIVSNFDRTNVQDLIKNYVNINCLDNEGRNLLFYSSERNIPYLVERGLDINSSGSLKGKSLYTFDFNKLFALGLDINQNDLLLYSPITETTKLLVLNGAKIDNNKEILDKILETDSCKVIEYIMKVNPEIGNILIEKILNGPL